MNALGLINIVVIYEFAVIKRDKGKHHIHILFAVNGVHVLCCHFVLLSLISDYPCTSRRKKSSFFSYFTKYQIIDVNYSLNFFLVWFELCLCLVTIFNRSRLIITKYIITIWLVWTLNFLFNFYFNFLLFIILKHSIIFSKLSLNLFFIIIFNFCHKTEIYKIVYLLLLILRPNVDVVFGFFNHILFFFLLFLNSFTLLNIFNRFCLLFDRNLNRLFRLF